MTDLKQCPFCGGQAKIETFVTAQEKKPRFRARCCTCWCISYEHVPQFYFEKIGVKIPAMDWDAVFRKTMNDAYFKKAADEQREKIPWG